MTAAVSERIAAKPGELTPTTTGTSVRAMTRQAMSTASSWSSFGASPSWPSTVSPSTPTSP